MEKELINFTNDELIDFIKKSREIHSLEEYDYVEQIITDRVRRVLDLRDVLQDSNLNHKRTRRIINKYIKPMKKEVDVKKLLKNQNEDINEIEVRYLAAMIDLMIIVNRALDSEIFQRNLKSLETCYEFGYDDLVLVNGIIKALEHENSFSISRDIVINALDDAIFEYVYCIENDIEYESRFNKKSNFVYYPKLEEQEEKDE